MYVAIMALAMTAGSEPAQCSSRAACSASVQRVTVVRASCSTGATKAACSTTVAATCSGRVGLFANHHARKADRLQARADRHYNRAGGVYVEVTPAVTPTPAKTPDKAK